MAQSVWDWQILNQTDKETTVLLMILKKEELEERISIIKGAGLKLISIEPTNVAVFNTAHYFYKEINSKIVAFLDLEPGWVDVVVNDCGKLSFSRGIYIPKGIEATHTWVGEVRHTLIAYDQKYPTRRIEEVIIFGSKEIVSFLQEKKFEQPLQRRYRVIFPTIDGYEPPANINIASLIGPVLRHFDMSTSTFYLAKVPVETLSLGKAKKFPLAVKLVAIPIILLVIGYIYTQIQIMQQKKEIKKIDEKISSLKSMQIKPTPSFSKIVPILEAIPEKIWIENIDSTGPAIRGEAESTKIVDDFIVYLSKKKLGSFEPGRYTRVTREGKELWSFDIRKTMKVKEKKKEEEGKEEK
jgi:hypothetical protein